MAKATDIQRAGFIEAAEKYTGYQCRPGNVSSFGGLTGYQGLPWDGSFIDVVAREAGVSLPACVYSPSGLAEFINGRRWHAKPQPGDIVFFTWSTGEKFGSPHVGIVTDTTDWQLRRQFRTIEAMTDSGLARSSKIADGVFPRLRHGYEVLGFGRPDFRQRPGGANEIAGGQPEIRFEMLRPGRANADIQRVQLALGIKCGLRNVQPGKLDGSTIAAYARWQRMCGFVGSDASGIPDIDSLVRLGRETRCFTVKLSSE